MSQTSFSQVNTGVSVREERFLTEAQFDQLLNSRDQEARSQLLQASPYGLAATDLSNVSRIEERLMNQLLSDYAWAFEVTPNPDMVSLFTLKYTYHNLKVFLKHRATERKLGHLLLSVGPYSLDVLEHLVATFSAEYCPAFMAEEVAATWQEYQDYQDLRVLEIGMDLAYFKHLKQLQLEHPALENWVKVLIDFYNVITVLRAHGQDKPRSFMKQLLSDEGTLSADAYIQMVEEGNLSSWFTDLNPVVFDLDVRVYEERMHSGQLRVQDIEYLADLLLYKILDEGRYETDGPLPLARYLYGRELEVKNLRLILTGLDNELPRETIKERMRPIYGR